VNLDDTFIDLPPADPVAFNLAKLAEPSLTYDEYIRRWQQRTRELREERLLKGKNA
jgi:hypothetical protein